MSPYWYFISTWYCPLCGHTDEYRERRTSEKPERSEDRREFVEYRCGCDA